jgi:hypothetical protein
MKTAILAVLLLLLAVASIASEAPMEMGKLGYGEETCLAVILQMHQHYKIFSLLNYELRHDIWGSAGKT